MITVCLSLEGSYAKEAEDPDRGQGVVVGEDAGGQILRPEGGTVG